MTNSLDFTAQRDERERVARHLADGSDDAAAARILGQCPGLAEAKIEVAERLLARDPGSTSVIPLIRHLGPTRLARLATDSVGKPERSEIVVEVARHEPEAVRPHVKRIRDERVLSVVRAEAPDDWIPPLLDAYQTTQDTQYVRAIGQIRTEAALDCLIDTSKGAPQEHIAAFALALENAGVSPQTRQASI